MRAALAQTVSAGADIVVLGCTHYEFLAPTITTEFPGVSVLGTGEPVAKRACALLAELDLEAPPDAVGAFDLIVSGNREAFLETLPRLGFAPAADPRRPSRDLLRRASRQRSREAGSFVCVGLDPPATCPSRRSPPQPRPHRGDLPVRPCYKPNLAFYEQFGIPGLRALEATLEAIPDGIPVIADGKRATWGTRWLPTPARSSRSGASTPPR